LSSFVFMLVFMLCGAANLSRVLLFIVAMFMFLQFLKFEICWHNIEQFKFIQLVWSYEVMQLWKKIMDVFEHIVCGVHALMDGLLMDFC